MPPRAILERTAPATNNVNQRNRTGDRIVGLQNRFAVNHHRQGVLTLRANKQYDAELVSGQQ